MQVLYALDVKTGEVKGFTIIDPEFNGELQGDGLCRQYDLRHGDSESDWQDSICARASAPARGTDSGQCAPYLYLAYASHNDQTPYWGLVLGYNVSNPANMTLQGEFNTHPSGTNEGAGVWMGGAGPALDPTTNQLFFATGNGSWNRKSARQRLEWSIYYRDELRDERALPVKTDATTIVNVSRGSPR